MLIISVAFICTLTSCAYILSENPANDNNSETQKYEIPKEIKDLKELPTSEGLDFTLSKDNASYTLTGIGTCIDVDIVIPFIYEGLPVTQIDNNVFRRYTALRNIVIPNTIIEIPAYTFSDCTNLENVIIGNCVTKIGHNAFSGCSKLKNVFLGNSVKEIEYCAFDKCSSLEFINIPNTVSKIGAIFSSYKTLKMNSYEGGNYLGNSENPFLLLVSIDNRELTTYKIHENTKIIYPSVFESCANLIAIDIPDSVTHIESSLFKDCRRLAKVTLGKSVEYIGSNAFAECSSLKEMTLNRSISSIGANAFDGCSALTKIFIPSSVTFIGSEAFLDCSSLNEIIFANYIDLKSIANRTFTNCTALTSITLPDSVRNIGEYAFSYCRNLETVNIPKDVYTIGNCAFDFCDNLSKIYFNATKMQDLTALNGVFSNCGSKYTNLTLIIGNGVQRVPSYLFKGSDYLKAIEFEDNSVCNSIGSFAFYNCNGLTCIKIPISVVSIENCAYVSCENVKAIYYEGTKDDWNMIQMVDTVNTSRVTLYYNYDI